MIVVMVDGSEGSYISEGSDRTIWQGWNVL